MAVKLIHLTCQHCGAALEMDSEKLIAYCPHCGQKLLFDVEQIGSILLEKERTKQKEIEHDLETKRIDSKEKRNHDIQQFMWFFVSFGFITLMIVLSAIFSH